MTTPILKVKQLRAAYGKAQVLHGLNVDVAKGSVITVIGPNGAGKSTFLNCLIGMLPSQGVIEFNGQSINELTLEERVMQGISLVPENRELFSTMTVEDNLMLGGKSTSEAAITSGVAIRCNHPRNLGGATGGSMLTFKA